MRETKVAVRYARSVVELARERNALEDVSADMRLIETTISQNKDLELLLKSPLINSDKKNAIIKSLFADKVDTLTISFVELMISKKREYLLKEIAQEYANIYRDIKGIIKAEVTSAQKLDDNIKSQIRAKIETNGEIEFIEKIDPSLIGGFIVRVGDKQFDGSISRSFADLKKNFSKNEYIPSI